MSDKKKPTKYLNKRGYVIYKHDFTIPELREIRKDLSVRPFMAKGFERNVASIPIFLENDQKMYLPREYALKKLGQPEQNIVPPGKDIQLSFVLNLLPDQMEPVFQTMKGLKEKGGGILTLPCGFGKTICGIFMLCHMNNSIEELRQILFPEESSLLKVVPKPVSKGLKTLIVVHKSFLMTQWMDRIHFCFPDVKIGIVQGKKCEIEGKDIVIAMIKTLSMKEFPDKTFDSIGMVILDECHRIPCTLYYKALFKINSPYMLGLSATPERRDGLMKVLNMFIGDSLYSITGRFKNYYKIRRVVIESQNSDYNEAIEDFRGNPSYAKMLKNILLYKNRTMMIVNEIERCYVKEKRQILVLSHEIKHLEEMEAELKKRGIDDVAYFIGKLKKDQLKESEKKSILLASYSMADEGMDIPKMNTLILASPKTNIKQAVGRIDRIIHSPMKALVIDMVDTFSVFKKQGDKRYQYFKKYGFEIENCVMDDNGKVLQNSTISSKQDLKKEWDWSDEEDEVELFECVPEGDDVDDDDETPLTETEKKMTNLIEDIEKDSKHSEKKIEKIIKKKKISKNDEMTLEKKYSNVGKDGSLNRKRANLFKK